ncbi:hypothetical protein L9F63_012400 [Diploptera punctata]|uniref:Androgen-dependent TFPI-regulating protein n=1 Tax=Diploptera punctata TaxID=6984 RepID=A0AAD8ADX3_DIPPU|nr:hypothetical protein L9F63_012400 [Diploptera punctata]
MRDEIGRIFHAATVPLIIVLDIFYFIKLFQVLSVRTDLLYKHFLGLGLQFFTVWSQVALQLYFFVAFLYDIIEPGEDLLVKQLKRAIHVFKSVFFTSVVVPASAVNLIEDTRVFQDLVPSWMDHSLHTNVIFFTLAELLLCYRPYPRSSALGRMRSTVIVLGYTSWVTFAVLIGSSWPYPFLKQMTVLQRLCFLLGNCVLAAYSYSAGHYINSAAWKHRTTVVEK